MKMRSVFFLCLVCCLGLLVTGCSFTRSGKAAKDAEAFKKAEQARTAVPVPDKPWEKYGVDGRGVEYYYQKDTVSFPTKTTVHVWRKRTFRQRPQLKEIVSFDEIDCKTEKYRSLQTQGVRQDDSTTEMYVTPSPWYVIYDDSADDFFLNTSCKEINK